MAARETTSAASIGSTPAATSCSIRARISVTVWKPPHVMRDQQRHSQVEHLIAALHRIGVYFRAGEPKNFGNAGAEKAVPGLVPLCLFFCLLMKVVTIALNGDEALGQAPSAFVADKKVNAVLLDLVLRDDHEGIEPGNIGFAATVIHGDVIKPGGSKAEQANGQYLFDRAFTRGERPQYSIPIVPYLAFEVLGDPLYNLVVWVPHTVPASMRSLCLRMPCMTPVCSLPPMALPIIGRL